MKKIGVIGLGKLGLCLALVLERAGFVIIGYDVDASRIEAIIDKSLKSNEPFVEDYIREASHLQVSNDISTLISDDIELIFILVATPSSPDGGYDHKQIETVESQLMEYGIKEKKVDLIIGCTTMPGYCDSLAERMSTLNYEVSYNPEFISQGNIIQDMVNPDQVLIGTVDRSSGEKLTSIYKKISLNNPEFHIMDRLSAEICKLATNCFLTTKISFANSIGDLAVKVGADPDKILNAIGSDSRIGRHFLKYGFGYGGPCLPRDNRALGLYASLIESNLLIGKATDETNKNHLEFQFEKWMQMYAEDEEIVFESITYKKGTDILEESQRLALALKLANSSRKVTIIESSVVINKLKDLYGDLFVYQEVPTEI